MNVALFEGIHMANKDIACIKEQLSLVSSYQDVRLDRCFFALFFACVQYACTTQTCMPRGVIGDEAHRQTLNDYSKAKQLHQHTAAK